MKNKVYVVYAIVDNQSGVVFARLFVRPYQYVEVGPARVGIRDYWNPEPYGLHRIVEARVSSDPEDLEKIKHLDSHDFVSVNTHKDYECDYLLYVNNIDAFESQFH